MRPISIIKRRDAFTWSESPYEAIWDNLRVLQQPSAMTAVLTGETGARVAESIFDFEAAERKAQEISYLIIQAEEYFRAADVVTLATKPLPLYYGMLTLAKALILAWDRDASLLDIKYHGLDTRPRSNDLKLYRETPEKWRLGDEYACVNEGIFRRLANVVQGVELEKGSVLRLDQIIRTDAEIAVAYNRINKFSSLTFPLYHLSVTDTPYRITICPSTKDRQEFIQLFDFMSRDFEVADDLYHHQALIVRSAPHVQAWPEYLGIQKPSAGGRFLVGPTLQKSNGKPPRFLTREVGDFAAVFILSDLVRYRPEFWIEVVRGDRRGNIGLISLFLSACRRRFPHFVLNGLYGEHFEFGVQARLG